jgi:hypothetical protein
MSVLTMPRPKRTETVARHTAASIEHVANELEAMVNTLRTTAAMLSGTPKITDVELRYERSLSDGLRYMKLWTHEVQSVVSEARLDAVKKPQK